MPFVTFNRAVSIFMRRIEREGTAIDNDPGTFLDQIIAKRGQTFGGKRVAFRRRINLIGSQRTLRGGTGQREVEGISLNESIRIREPSRVQEFYIGDLSAYSLGAKRNSTFRTGRFRLILSAAFPSTCRQAFEESISISIARWMAKI